MLRNIPFLITLLVGSSAGLALAADTPHEVAYTRQVRPFLKLHCIACHGPDKQKGGVRFDGPMPDLTNPKLSATWLAAKRLLAQGEMPPEGKPRPRADELIAVLAWIDEAASRAAAVTRGGVGRRALRRLTAREYVNTLQDLLGLSFPHALLDLSARLPSDVVANNFSNDSNLQVMQTLQLRRSLDLAEDLLAVALPGESAIQPLRYDVDLCRIVGEVLPAFAARPEADQKKLRGPAIQNIALPSQLTGGAPARLSVRGDRNGPLAAEHLDPARGLLLEPNPIILGVNRNAITIVLPFVPDRGVLRLKARAAALMEHDDGCPVLRLSLGGPQAPGNAAYPVAEVSVTAAANAPREYVLEVPLLLTDSDWNSFRREKRLFLQIDNAAALLGPTPIPANYDQKQRDSYLKRNRLLLQSFTLEIESSATWPPKSEAVLLAKRDAEDEHSWAQRSLRALLTRAFRRPPEQAELDAYLRLYRAERDAGSNFLAAYRTAVAAALISPQVYYLVETKHTDRRPLSGWELASRLSYLVWNTTPDAELLNRAADGSLLAEAELRRQLHRLLADERAYAFSREFTRQWLDLDVINHLEPPVTRLGKTIDNSDDLAWYDKVIRRDLAAEPAHYLLDLLRQDCPVSQLVISDHVVVNDRLARYYGVADVKGPGWRRAVAPANRRGGLLTQAGVVAAATHAQERGEIKRGVYLVERLLGIDIPSPPGNVDIKPLDVQLKEDKSLLKLTARQHMERHRTAATCAVCHQRSDPLGFVWDEFDMYGQPKRDRQGKLLDHDSSGSLPDKTPFADFAEFRRLLTDGAPGESRFSAAFSQRLFAYVLGRGLDHGDEVHLKTIRAAAAREGGGVRALLTAMVVSEPFRHK
jgi:mono/diheme cytochrome c family protein